MCITHIFYLFYCQPPRWSTDSIYQQQKSLFLKILKKQIYFCSNNLFIKKEQIFLKQFDSAHTMHRIALRLI